jgi:hypothetical protein
MICEHRNQQCQLAVVLAPSDAGCVFDDGVRRVAGQAKCIDCGKILPWGESNDEPEAVQAEIRAAELARHQYEMEHRPTRRFRPLYAEIAGWHGEETIGALHVRSPDGTTRVDKGVPLNLDSPNWIAGYLANRIALHDIEVA